MSRSTLSVETSQFPKDPSMDERDVVARARQTLLSALVAAGPASTRLTNAMHAGATSGRLPCETVGEYLDNGPKAQELFCQSLSNFGRNTAQELESLVRDYMTTIMLGSPIVDTNLCSNNSGLAIAREKSIEELVAAGPASVRLTNAILRGADEGSLPCKTVGEYMDKRSSVQEIFRCSVANFGRKSARELDALIVDYLETVSADIDRKGDSSSPKSGSIHDREGRLNAIIAQLDDLSIADAVTGQSASRRLVNALQLSGFAERPLLDLLIDSGSFRAELLRQPNFGRTSLDELEKLGQIAVIHSLASVNDEPSYIVDQCALILRIPDDGPRKENLTRLVSEALRSRPPRIAGLDQLLDWALAGLPEREMDIVLRRYGFAHRIPETLEQISEGYGVTRERIRQLEAKAIGRLRAKLSETSLPKLVEGASEPFWAERDVPFLVLEPNDANQLRRKLAPCLALALDILDQSVFSWLDDTSIKMTNGYLSLTVDAKQTRALGAKLVERLENQPVPISAREVLGDHKQYLSIVQAAVALETPFVFFEGYILLQRPGVRLMRAVRLHNIMSSSASSFLPIEIAEIYVSIFPNDGCGIIDLLIVMESCPQLFIEIGESRWAAIGRGGALATAERGSVVAKAPYEIDGSTIAGSLQVALRDRGPSSIGELMRDCKTILPPGRSPSSIGPILITRPDLFRRLLPGIYALPAQVPTTEEILRAPMEYLLTEAQGRIYAFARLAGEPHNTFPMWLPEAEYRLCKWARFNASTALFHSLLAIANVGIWPIEPDLKAEWMRVSDLQGRFELMPPSASLSEETRPKLDRLLAACLIAVERGSIGWMQANRILGRRIDSSAGHALLGLMVALGILRAPENVEVDARFLSHPKQDRASMLIDRLRDELIRHGELRWDSALGHSIAGEALSATSKQLGWVSHAELVALLQKEQIAETAPLTEDDPIDGEVSDDDLMARLLTQHRRGVGTNRRQQAAKWLLED